MSGWIGVDLDGTLAHYEGWKGVNHIGDPIPNMVRRITAWQDDGIEIRIFTARACTQEGKEAVEEWLQKWGFTSIMVTNEKDYAMIELWDDRCIQVAPNMGDPMYLAQYRAK